MALTIDSTCGLYRAVVAETGDGCEVKYYKNWLDDGRGIKRQDDNVLPLRRWKHQRTAMMPVPFHVALDQATAIVQFMSHDHYHK